MMAVKNDQSGAATTTHDQSIQTLATAAQSAGVEFSAEEGAAWLHAVEVEAADHGDFDVRRDHGIGGFDVALLDFDPASAARLQIIGEVIKAKPRPNIRAALAIAGSAAQGRIQPFPADNDFFERWHISASTIEEARATFADALRYDVIQVLDHPAFLLDDVCFGSRHGRPLRWNADSVVDGTLRLTDPDGTEVSIGWHEAATDPGFTKTAWVLVDPAFGGPGMASKVIDATWQDAEGTIVSLDGMIDGEFQQVYLDAEGAELAAEVTRSVSGAARVRYITDLESQVAAYSRGEPPNFAKVAKRLYNICRITRRYDEALYLRELFDEPPARLIQIESRLWVASRKVEFDLEGALADLRSATAACQGLVPLESMTVVVVDDSRLTAEHVSASIAELVEAISAAVTVGFEQRLRAYEPVVALLNDIASRYPPD